MHSSNRNFFLAGLLALAFSLRAGYSLSLPNQLSYADAWLFDDMAWNLVSEGRYITHEGLTSERTPSFVVFLATAYAIAGHHYIAARLFSAALGTLLVLIIMALGRCLILGSGGAWLAGAMAALYPFYIYYEGQLLSDSFIAFWLAASLFLWYRWRSHPDSWAKAFLCGASFAVLCLTKTIFIPYVAGLAVIEGILLWRQKSPLFLKQWALAAIIWMLPIFLWGFRNQRMSGHFFLDSHGGTTMLQSIVYHEGSRDGTFTWNKFTAEDPIGRKAAAMTREADREAFYIAQTKKYIRDDPLRYLRQSCTRFKDFWRFYPRQDLEYREGRRSLTWVSLLTEPFLILAGFFGLWKARRQWRRIYPVYFCIAWLTFIYSATSGSLRYRLPLMSFLMIFSAYAICSMTSKGIEE